MGGYQPLHITGNETGLVQDRENFLLPADAYPVLENAYVWRERLKRKDGYQLLGRLERNLTNTFLAAFSETAPVAVLGIFGALIATTTLKAVEVNASVVPGSVAKPVIIDFLAPTNQTLTDTTGTGVFTISGSGTNITAATIDYATGAVTITFTSNLVGANANITMNYYPNLPVMGIRTQELATINDETIFFDMVYAYNFNTATNSFEEYSSGVDNKTWTGNNSQFFWSTNYWVDKDNNKIFWANNNKDPIRYTNSVGTGWYNFTPQVNVGAVLLLNALCIVPFRGRLVAFNTEEGTVAPGLRYSNRIRWAEIGNPFTTVSTIVTTVSADAWRDDIRGKGGFLNIPTNEDIISVGFVRDNLVIYCERSTWQLRYTGRTIAPFQIEKVNSELGATGTFSAIQFDTSLVGIGDKGVVECDSYKSEKIDIKIPDLVFNFQDQNQAPARVHGIRNFETRLAFWTYVPSSQPGSASISNPRPYPSRRLVYNYENDSWAIFTDSLTTLGFWQASNSRTWINTHLPWIKCNFSWTDQPQTSPVIVGGNQQGFIERLDVTTTNDPSLYIRSITANGPLAPTRIESPSHNLDPDSIIEITGIIGMPFSGLNNQVFLADIIDKDNFDLFVYNSSTREFSSPQIDTDTGYIGGGLISVRDNFNITSKKFNYMEQGQACQLGYLDILMDSTSDPSPGAISLNVYLDYNDSQASNTMPQNIIEDGSPIDVPDTFFNQIIPTTQSSLNTKGGTKFWQRVFCATRASFITLQYTFSNAQMAGIEQELNVQIDAQVLWMRPGGRNTQI